MSPDLIVLAQGVGETFQQTVASGPILLALGACVLAGLVSFASPCVIPLVPGYLAYLASVVGAERPPATAAAAERQRAAAATLTLDERRIPWDDPVARLDVSLLQDNLIEPILGIVDPRRDDRINFVGGIRGLEGLAQPVDEGRYRVAFSLFPTRMTDLMAVADAGEVMPPKSTWFEPKLADGLVSHVLD